MIDGWNARIFLLSQEQEVSVKDFILKPTNVGEVQVQRGAPSASLCT
jgi:hypothetical protein